MAPGLARAAAPSLPSHTAREASSSATIVTMASASIAASAGEDAQRAPRAIRSSALGLLRFQTATAKPASRYRPAMPWPMRPRPMKATVVIGQSIHILDRARRGAESALGQRGRHEFVEVSVEHA